MKIAKADAKYIDMKDLTPYQIIEKAGRTCYKSEKAITKDSAAKFVQKLTENQHTAMLEHAHVYMTVNKDTYDKLRSDIAEFKEAYAANNMADIVTPFLFMTYIAGDYVTTDDLHYISGSFRTFLNMFHSGAAGHFNNLPEIYKTLSNNYPEIFQPGKGTEKMPEAGCKLLTRQAFKDNINSLPIDNETKRGIIMKHLTHTIMFTCDRGVSHEFVRHRTASFAQESTRYCNYANDKFGNEITVIEPCYWANDKESSTYRTWKTSCEQSEIYYFELIGAGATAQEARAVLPNSLKTELVITATEQEWQHIINLRYHGTTGKPHPQMLESMTIAYPLLTSHSDNRLR